MQILLLPLRKLVIFLLSHYTGRKRGGGQLKPIKEQLTAIENCDKKFDSVFYYGVKSTRIFCKPSYRSRMPKPENILIAEHPEDLEQQGYRPCKRCKPTNVKLPDEEWIEHVQHFIDRHFAEKLTLEYIASETHSSPYHLHRKFKEISGKTIHDYLKDVRMQHAIKLLIHSDKKIAEIGTLAGISNSAQFVRNFREMTGRTPAQYRKEENK